jgi:hypothetical protein
MKMYKRSFLVIILLASAGAALASDAALQVYAVRAQDWAQAFGKNLQTHLRAALTQAGPLAAVEVCQVQAPRIAKESGAQQGADIGRTSLKVRSPANAPDAWEAQVLADFAARQAKGEALDKMEYYAVVAQDNQRQFRYMKAIAVQQPCLLCHGETLEPSLQAKITTLYPQDQATGYKLGDLRGAFSVSHPMP